MARGQVSKDIITSKILSVFEGAFKYDKEIRIPIMEDGEEIQIKVTLTAAKTNVTENGEVPLGKEEDNKGIETTIGTDSKATELTQTEKDNVARLLSSLGL